MRLDADKAEPFTLSISFSLNANQRSCKQHPHNETCSLNSTTEANFDHKVCRILPSLSLERTHNLSLSISTQIRRRTCNTISSDTRCKPHCNIVQKSHFMLPHKIIIQLIPFIMFKGIVITI